MSDREEWSMSKSSRRVCRREKESAKYGASRCRIAGSGWRIFVCGLRSHNKSAAMKSTAPLLVCTGDAETPG